MSKHSRRKTRSAPLLQVVAMVLGVVAGAVVWWYLVEAAIRFTLVARDGQSNAWLFTAAATLGAVVSLMIVLSLGARALYALGLVSDYKPRRAAGRGSD